MSKSEHLQWFQFQESVAQIPLHSQYLFYTADGANQNGYNFFIKSPHPEALLDTEAVFEYSFSVTGTVAAQPADAAAAGDGDAAAAVAAVGVLQAVGRRTLAQYFGFTVAGAGLGLGDEANHSTGAATTQKVIALRGGNIITRATQNFAMTINGVTISDQPYKWWEPVARTYVSPEKSRGEFGASGGLFDNGNHSGYIMKSCNYMGRSFQGNPGGAAPVPPILGLGIICGPNHHAVTDGADDYATPEAQIAADGLTVAGGADLTDPSSLNMALDERFIKFGKIFRQTGVRTGAGAATLNADVGAANGPITFTVYERFPLQPFKNFESDEVMGVIPNVNTITINAVFFNLLAQRLIRADDQLDFTVQMFPAGSPRLHCIWYTPPQGFTIPRQISLPMKRYSTYSKRLAPIPIPLANWFADGPIQTESQINLESIPDVIYIYACFAHADAAVTTHFPDSGNMEFLNIRVALEGADGKLLNLTTYQMYLKWLRAVHWDKHTSSVTPYDEWRKYLCVVVIKPEDLGLLYGSGYMRPTQISITYQLRNHWAYGNGIGKLPGTGLAVGSGLNYNHLGRNASYNAPIDLHVVSCYAKNSLTLTADGGGRLVLQQTPSDMGQSQYMSRAPMALGDITL